MSDSKPPETSVNRRLTPEEILDINKSYKDRLLSAWEGNKVARGVINGELMTTESSKDYTDPLDKSKWKHSVARVSNAPQRLVVRSHSSSARSVGTLVEEVVELDDNPTHPALGIRRSIIGNPGLESPQFKSDDNTATLPHIEEMIRVTERNMQALRSVPTSWGGDQ